MQIHFFTHTIVHDEPTQLVSMASDHLDHLNEFGSVEAITIQVGELPDWIEGDTKLKADPNEGDFGAVWLETLASGGPCFDAGELRALAAQCLHYAELLDRALAKSEGENIAAHRILLKREEGR